MFCKLCVGPTLAVVSLQWLQRSRNLYTGS